MEAQISNIHKKKGGVGADPGYLSRLCQLNGCYTGAEK